MKFENETKNSSACKQLRNVWSDMSDHEAGKPRKDANE